MSYQKRSKEALKARQREAYKAKQDVKAPGRMPRPSLSEVDVGEDVLASVLDGQYLSPLGIYLKNVAKVSLGSFARAMGVSSKTVSEWATGKGMPLIPAAYEIERLTKGVVPIECWLGLPQAKSMIAKMRNQQPVRRKGRVATEDFVAPGGFASPTGQGKGT